MAKNNKCPDGTNFDDNIKDNYSVAGVFTQHHIKQRTSNLVDLLSSVVNTHKCNETREERLKTDSFVGFWSGDKTHTAALLGSLIQSLSSCKLMPEQHEFVLLKNIYQKLRPSL